jgi:alpha-L-fucosidase
MDRTRSVSNGTARRVCAGFLLLLFLVGAAAAQKPDPRGERAARMAWWTDARFGMFIHWGLYAVPAGEWKGETSHGEWIRTTAQIPLKEYDAFAGKLNPVKFDARSWVRMAKDAGMKYIVITSKHHDGFCLFDASASDFDIMATPFGRDALKELSAAAREEGIKLCFYYSIMDWHHPDYLPRREWEKSRSADGADFARYIRYMKSELKDLLTNYGEIGVLWFDGEWEATWNDSLGRDLEAYVRSLQPGIIVNNRVGASRAGMEGFSKDADAPGDFGTPEQEIPAKGLPGVSWESCMTMNDHWGFNARDTNFKSTRELVRNLAEIASKGGNFLLNVGPTSEGLFPAASVDRLRGIGEWMKVNGESIYGTQASPFTALAGAYCTQKPRGEKTRLYFHILDWPADGVLRIPGLLNAADPAFLLADPAQPLPVVRKEDALLVAVGPAPAPGPHAVIAVDIDGAPDVSDPPIFGTDVRIFVGSTDVSVSSPRSRVEVRYTTDGSVPAISSPIVQGPIRIAATTTVSARCFRDGRPVSGPATATFAKAAPWPAATPADPVPGIRFAYYEGEWDSLPAFAALSPLSRGILPNISFSPRRQEERFGFVYTGWVTLPADGVYAFYTNSDDGSRLFLDDSLLVDNNGLHGMQEVRGVAPLGRGAHRLTVQFFERTGGDDLRVSYEGPGIPKQLLPDGALSTERNRP